MGEIRRRDVISGGLAFVSWPAFASDDPSYLEYSYQDYFDGHDRGPTAALPPDINKAISIANQLPYGDHVKVMAALAAITDRGTTGELFNERWRKVGNPLIVKFFHDIGYRKTPYPGDCTPWCAATASWCLRRVGKSIPSDPASSQSFLRYGTKVAVPKYGDLCVFTDIVDPGRGHVGLYVSHTATDVDVLGGNQEGGVSTMCGPGYRKSKISVASIPINARRDPKLSVHYLAAYVRPI